MQSITATIYPSGAGKIFCSPLGLSREQNFINSLKAQRARKRNELKREYATPQPEGECCDLKDRKAWVPNELSGTARRGIIEGCGVIEDRYGRRCTGFMTGTLPTRCDGLYEEIDKSFKTVTARFLEKVKYHIRKGGGEYLVVTKVEFHADGWPHFHMAYLSRNHRRGRWFISKELMQKLWQDSWVRAVPALSNADWSKSTRVETIRKSAGRYMAKYMSKVLAKQTLSGPTSIRRFWGSSQRTKQLIRLATWQLSSEGWDLSFLELRRSLQTMGGHVGVSKLVFTESGGMWMGLTISKKHLDGVVGEIERLMSLECDPDTLGFYERFGMAIA